MTVELHKRMICGVFLEKSIIMTLYSKISSSYKVNFFPVWTSRKTTGLFLLALAGVWHADEAISQTSQTQSPLILRQAQEINYTLGLGAMYGATYLGSNDYKFSSLPILALQYGPFFLDPARGLGVEYGNDLGFYAGTSIQLDRGRKDEDDLSGMGRIRSSWVLDLAVSQALAEWVVVDAGVSFRLAGQKDRGKQYRVGLTFIPYQSDSDVITLGVNAQMGDKDYNQTYFGVTPEQAARTRFSAFSPASGVHAQTLQVGWSHVLDKNWALDAGAGVTRLGSKVKNSPIVFDDTSYTIGAGISYVF